MAVNMFLLHFVRCAGLTYEIFARDTELRVRGCEGGEGMGKDERILERKYSSRRVGVGCHIRTMKRKRQ